MRVDTAIEGLDAAPIVLGNGEGRAESELRKLAIGGNTLFVLKQRGTFPGMTYDHSRLLAPEIAAGAFPEIMSTIARGVDFSDQRIQHVASAVYRGYTKRVLDHVSDEFRQAIKEVAAGLKDAFSTSPFTDDDVRHALVAIEVGNLIEGLARRFSFPVIRAAAAVGALAIARPFLLVDDVDSFVREAKTNEAIQNEVAVIAKVLSDFDNRVEFGCTGLSVPASMAKDGKHLHGRILDADLYQWNTAPVLFLIDETPSNDDYHKYAAFGTAGLIYPGGISGINDAGIGVSLHQLSTTQYDSSPTTGRGDIAPFVQQRILREAGTLDEAIAVVRNAAHFAAWVFLISDAKTGETVRVEVSGNKEQSSEKYATVVGQSNHFFTPDFPEKDFRSSDRHFTPTFGKWLETHARYYSTTDALRRSLINRDADTDWAIEHLASSHDWWLADTLKKQGLDAEGMACDRTFGRVVRRVYGQVTTIVRADPDRKANADELWMSIGDRLPSAHALFAGFNIDWETMTITPVTDSPVRRAGHYQSTGRDNWAQSTERYVLARTSIARPRDASGDLLRRKGSDEEKKTNLERSEAQLTAAIELAGRDGIVEVPYHYMRARVRHQQGAYQEAREDWNILLDVWGQQNGQPATGVPWPALEVDPPYVPRLIEFEAGLVHLLSTATEDCIVGHLDWNGRAQRLDEARRLLESVKQHLFGDQRAHFDLENWIDIVAALKDEGGAEIDLPDPNFITVE